MPVPTLKHYYYITRHRNAATLIKVFFLRVTLRLRRMLWTIDAVGYSLNRCWEGKNFKKQKQESTGILRHTIIPPYLKVLVRYHL